MRFPSKPTQTAESETEPAPELANCASCRKNSTWYRMPSPSVVALISVVVLVAGILVVVRHSPARAYQPSDLPKIEAQVRRDFADVVQLSPRDFTALRSTAAPLVVDVRENGEFAVSHIDGAVRVDPDISVSEFVEKIAKSATGRNVVLYCSVGVRSSKLAARANKALQSLSVKGVYNLEGGLFRWHNERRNLVDATGATERIHPYDAHWGGLVARQDQVATTPR